MSELVLENKNDLPKGWVKTKLEDIVESIIDKDHTTPKYIKENGIPLISPKDFTNNSIDFSNPKLISKIEYIQICKKCEPKFGDLLFSRIGTIGKVRKVPENKIFNILHSIVLIRPNPKIAIQGYLFYLLQTQSVQLQAKRDTKSVGTPDLGIVRIRNFDVICPPLNEQKRIVAKIEELFPLLDSTKEILEKTKILLKQYRQFLLKSAFEGKLTIEWRNDNNEIIKEDKKIQNEISIELGDLKKQTHQENGTLHVSQLFEIPSDWIWARFYNIAKIGQGGTPSTNVQEYWNGDIPWLRSGDVRNNFIKNSNVLITKLGLQNSSTTLCSQGTVLLAMTGEGVTRGRSAVLEIEACANQSVAHIIPNKKRVLDKFLFYYLQSQYWKIRSVYKGSNQPGLNVSIIKQFEMPIPSISEQIIVVQKIEESFSLIQNSEKLVDSLLLQNDSMKNSILKQAFEGKILPQDPNDEPAEILLQKIKQEKQKIINQSKRGKKNDK